MICLRNDGRPIHVEYVRTYFSVKREHNLKSLSPRCAILMLASTPLTLRKSRMRRRARTDLCKGRPGMVVPPATAIREMPVMLAFWETTILQNRPKHSLTGGWSATRQLLIGKQYLCPCFFEFRSTIRSTKGTVFDDFGGLRRSPQVCKSLKNLGIQDCRGRGRGFEPRRPRQILNILESWVTPKKQRLRV
jgi:hypothetical protein